MEEHATIFQDLFCISLWFVILLLLKKGYKPPYINYEFSRLFGTLLLALFSIFSFIDGDYFNYKQVYNMVVSGHYWHFEPVYNWLIENVVSSYTAFRICVWGGATLLLYWAYNRLSEKRDLTLYIFALCYLPWFSYARVSVSMALILLGLSYIVKPIRGNIILSCLGGIFILGGAYFFHKSAVIGVAAAFVALFLMNVKKQTVVLLLIFVPFVSFLMGYFIELFLSIDLSSDYMLIRESSRSHYFSSSTNSLLESFGGGVGFIIQNILSLGSLYLSAVLYYFLVKDGLLEQFPVTIRVVASYMFFVVLISFGILISPTSFSAMHYRIMYFAMPANAIFLTSIKYHQLKFSFYKIIFAFAALGSVYNLIYSFYRCVVTL